MGNKFINPFVGVAENVLTLLSCISSEPIELAREKPFQNIFIPIQYANHITGHERFGSPFRVVPYTRDSDMACREDETTQRSIIDSFSECGMMIKITKKAIVMRQWCVFFLRFFFAKIPGMENVFKRNQN